MRDRFEQILIDLYRAQLETTPDGYLAAHSGNRAVISRQVDAYLMYRPFVEGRRILDWGCRHAPDSCLLRADHEDALELHGCDVEPAPSPVFHRYAGLSYDVLEHAWRLPYDDGMFDTVIGSGVLEHVPNDSESLKELHRVLKPDGTLIVLFLPNRASYTEFVNGCLGREHHRRRYAKAEIVRTLLHHGFEPVSVRYHQVAPTLAGTIGGSPSGFVRSAVEVVYRANALLERIWVVRRFAANIMIVARKRTVID